MGQPKLEKMSNESGYWGVVSKSGSGGRTGGIQDGHFAASDEFFTFGNTLKIPKNGSDENRMFIQTPAGSFRIWCEKNDDGSWTVTIKGSENNQSAAVVQEYNADADEKLALTISDRGEPSVS